MNTKFTKGEWQADIYGLGEHIKVCVYVPGGGFEITNIPDAEANAHLIAAAPDMYAALEYLQSIFNHESRSVTILDVDKIELLLAKAKGE